MSSNYQIQTGFLISVEQKYNNNPGCIDIFIIMMAGDEAIQSLDLNPVRRSETTSKEDNNIFFSCKVFFLTFQPNLYFDLFQ